MTAPLRFTLDSNILVYAADASEPTRQAAAIDIIARAARRDCLLTPQALAEFFHATTRKRIVPRAEAARQVRAWTVVFPITLGAGAAALLTALDQAVAGRLQVLRRVAARHRARRRLRRAHHRGHGRAHAAGWRARDRGVRPARRDQRSRAGTAVATALPHGWCYH